MDSEVVGTAEISALHRSLVQSCGCGLAALCSPWFQDLHVFLNHLRGVIRCRCIFSGKNEEPTPDFPHGVSSSFRARMRNCRVGKGCPAGSIELRVSPPPSKIPYGGFSPVRLQMDRQWRPSTTSRGLSAVHIRLMRPSYTPPQLQLPGIRDPRRDYPFENLSVQCGTTPNN